MTKFSGLIVGALLLLFAAYSGTLKYHLQSKTSLAYSRGDVIDSFELTGLDGEIVQLDSVLEENRYVWINFWATWCGPCRREMPMMAEIYETYNWQGFTILAISVGETPAAVEAWLKDNPVPFPVFVDDSGELADRINIEVLPTSILVDSTGRVDQVGTGIQEHWGNVIREKIFPS